MDQKTLLLELLSEEIPARMQRDAAVFLEGAVREGLKKVGVNVPGDPLGTASSDAVLVTPRRLILRLSGLPIAAPDVTEERRGPRIDAPEKAINGFLAACGVTRDQCEQRDTPKGTFLFATVHTKGRQTADVLKEVIEQTLESFPWPKSMRWGEGRQRWVRPLRSILCLFGFDVIPVQFAGVTADRLTRGHRLYAPEFFSVSEAETYEAVLRQSGVMTSAAERKSLLVDGFQRHMRDLGILTAEASDCVPKPFSVADEICGLVEWPVVLRGRIDQEFMDLPVEVRRSVMNGHQKYLEATDGVADVPWFIFVAENWARHDYSHNATAERQIIAGNERVLRARLSDALFFWQNDRRATLASRVEKLENRVFHAQLGTECQRVERMQGVALELTKYIQVNKEHVEKAVRLAKADLFTDMVGEFPELQGRIGAYYAEKDGEHPDVCTAISEQYTAGGTLKAAAGAGPSPVLACLVLADRLDTLAGFWAIEQKPTGSKDPFALRRAALRVIGIILQGEGRFRFPLRKIIDAALHEYARQDLKFSEHEARSRDLFTFFMDRLKVCLRDVGIRHDIVSAVLAGGDDDVYRLFCKAQALSSLLATEVGVNLLTAWRRATSIVAIESQKDGPYTGAIDRTLLEASEEKSLVDVLDTNSPRIDAALQREDFSEAARLLSEIRAPLDSFFTQVVVNASSPALRCNRLRILSSVAESARGFGDFHKIEGVMPTMETAA